MFSNPRGPSDRFPWCNSPDRGPSHLVSASFSVFLWASVEIICSTIEDMDTIICLDKGQIIESGSPKVLLQKRDGTFATLARLEQ